MSIDIEKLTPAELFIARRIAEFPMLYRSSDYVIHDCIILSRGDSYWTDDGLIDIRDNHYNKDTKEFEQYPLRMDLETAHSVAYNAPNIINPYFSYSSSFSSAPILNIPNNAEKSFLWEISKFLEKYNNLTEDNIKTLCETYFIMVDNSVQSQGTRFNNFMDFKKRIPSWLAKIEEVEYFQRVGNVDPKTFQGMYI